LRRVRIAFPAAIEVAGDPAGIAACKAKDLQALPMTLLFEGKDGH
jgi:hypothetical protein